jgi:hypothetical protein
LRGVNYDTIVGFDASVDRINVGAGGQTGWGEARTGTVDLASFDADRAALVDAALGSRQAVTVAADGGDQAGKLFAVQPMAAAPIPSA